jgi:hypothetical protein
MLSGTQLGAIIDADAHGVHSRPRATLGCALAVSLVGLVVGWPTADADAAVIAPLSHVTPVYFSDAADPSVIVVGGTLFAYTTGNGQENIPLVESTDRVHWRSVGDALPVLPAWVQSGYTWSPSVVELSGGGFEMFFDAYDATESVQCIGRATSAEPTGPFVDTSSTPFLCQRSLGGSIDASVYQQRTGDILVWKSDGIVGIWSERLSEGDSTLLGQPVLLLSPSETWEDGVIEGPTLVRIGGLLTLWFSAARWSDSTYAIGTARCSSALTPCDATSVSQELTSGAGLVGPGGPTFFHDDGQLFLAFSAWIGDARGLYLADVAEPDQPITASRG